MGEIVPMKEQRLQTRLDVEIQKQLKKRQWGEVIRLEIEGKIDKRLLDILKEEFAVKDSDVFEIGGFVRDIFD